MRESEWQPLHHKSLDFWQNSMTLAFEEEFQRHRLRMMFQRICFCGGFLVSHSHFITFYAEDCSFSEKEHFEFAEIPFTPFAIWLLLHALSNSIAVIGALRRRGGMFFWIPSCLGFKPATSQYKAYSLILLASNTVLVFQEGEPGVKESEENIVQKQHSVIPFTLRGRRLQNHLTISCTWIISMYYITAVRWKNTSSKKK